MGCGGPSTEGSFISPGAWGLNWSDVKRVNRMPTPSIMASSIPPITALPAIAATPLLAANIPPVAAPEIMEFHGSSFLRKYTSEQSMVENMPPHTANCPPTMGARCFTATRLPVKRREMPLGAFLKPLIAWNSPPPITPMEKAPPQSSTMRHGHGSLAYSSIFLLVWP